MKKILSLTVLFICLITAMARGTPTYLGTIYEKNDKEQSLEAFLGLDISYYDKIDNISGSGFFFGDEGKSETFLTDKYSGNLVLYDGIGSIDFLTVKASVGYNVYQLDNLDNNFSWSTEGIINRGGNQPAVSHLTLWTTFTPDNTGPNPIPSVPEPSSLILLGSGILIFLGIERKKLIKKKN